MKTILVPVDLSAATTRVCDAACAFAKLIKARLVLVHVVLPQPLIEELRSPYPVASRRQPVRRVGLQDQPARQIWVTILVMKFVNATTKTPKTRLMLRFFASTFLFSR